MAVCARFDGCDGQTTSGGDTRREPTCQPADCVRADAVEPGPMDPARKMAIRKSAASSLGSAFADENAKGAAEGASDKTFSPTVGQNDTSYRKIP